MKATLQVLCLFLIAPAMAVAEVLVDYRTTTEAAGIDSQLFYSSALVEPGQSQMIKHEHPWPWTLLIDGQPHYYPTQSDTKSTLRKSFQHETQQLDVGLYQIKHRYHAYRFSSVKAMLAPYVNAEVTRRFFVKRWNSPAVISGSTLVMIIPAHQFSLRTVGFEWLNDWRRL